MLLPICAARILSDRGARRRWLALGQPGTSAGALQLLSAPPFLQWGHACNVRFMNGTVTRRCKSCAEAGDDDVRVEGNGGA